MIQTMLLGRELFSVGKEDFRVATSSSSLVSKFNYI
jgi:hypothetical protein